MKAVVFFMIRYRTRCRYLLENKESIINFISRDKEIVEKAAKSKDTEATGKIVGIGKVLLVLCTAIPKKGNIRILHNLR
jgi:hypothetical protein